MSEIYNSQMLPIGTLLKQGEYRVERYIASGGFGNTYEVVHTRLPKHFAVKEFFMRGINQREGVSVTVSIEDNREAYNQMREKFYKEAQRLAMLEEPHIVEVTDFFEENLTAYYVMKLIDGESLAATMKRTGKPFSESEVRGILSQLLQALEMVHGLGIYHLDLKPGNIMHNAQGHCWLIDFGASKQLSAQESRTLSTSTGLSYTPGYAPGEQLSGNINRIGAWTDFYALGATLYNLLSNQTPPETDDVRFDGERAFHFPSDVSDDMRQFVSWLMQPDYPRRPQNVAEITARLATMAQPDVVKETVPPVFEEAVLSASEKTVSSDSEEKVQPASVEAVRKTPSGTVLFNKLKRRKLWPWFAGGVALILVFVSLLVLSSGTSDDGSMGYVYKNKTVIDNYISSMSKHLEDRNSVGFNNDLKWVNNTIKETLLDNPREAVDATIAIRNYINDNANVIKRNLGFSSETLQEIEKLTTGTVQEFIQREADKLGVELSPEIFDNKEFKSDKRIW